MNLQVCSSYLKAEIVYSILIKKTPLVIVTNKAFWFWGKDETKTEEGWTLEIDYRGTCGTRFTYSMRHADHAYLQTQFNALMKQIQDQDSQYADKMLEDAIIGGGSK